MKASSARRRAKRKRRAMVEERQRKEVSPYLAIAANRFLPPKQPLKFISFCSFIFNLILFVGLVVIVCAVLDYHCTSCESKCSMNSLSKNIEDIARNLASMEKNYHELETQISQFSKDLPKLEGQLELLGALASMEQNACRMAVWEPRSACYWPNVDVNLARGEPDAFINVPPKNYTKSVVFTETTSDASSIVV
ncbi:hypothetical protein NE865_00366 [Phthorimaea operculella]|nr:hypothetical protein NE865_00366 [Phthorimaea operculella]